MSTPRISVIGSLNLDLITRTPRLPSAGETLTATSFDTGCGGKGANQAVACARAARSRPDKSDRGPPTVHVTMIGAVGDDSYGTQLQTELSANDVDTSNLIRCTKQVSGIANIIVEEESGENRIMVIPGANGAVTAENFDGFTRLLQPSPDVVVLQLEIPLKTVLEVIHIAKQRGIEVLLNPAPPVQIPEESLKDLGHLIMNQTEALALAGETVHSQSGNSTEALQRMFKKFDALGVQNTIITLGDSGVCYSIGVGEYEHVPAVRVKQVKDTTAAGDTFVGYYTVEVARWRKERPHEAFGIGRAVNKANRAAAKTVEKAGAMQSIPWVDEV